VSELDYAEVRARAEKALRTPDLEWATGLVSGLASDVLALLSRLESPVTPADDPPDTNRLPSDRHGAPVSAGERECLRSALNWIIGFADSHAEHHTGFVHIRRFAEAALPPVPEEQQ
jgi:hypothetical protein